MEGQSSPAATSLRVGWHDVPGRIRAVVEGWLGSPAVAATNQPAGFSPGAAARLRTTDGRRVFVKAAGPEPNAFTPAAHRREAVVAAALPEEAPVPRLLWSHDAGEDGWVVLCSSRTSRAETPRCPGRIRSLAGRWTPSRTFRISLHPRHCHLAGCLDTRASGGCFADNTGGGWQRSARRADPDALTAVVAAVAGFFTGEGLQSAPPGLPTLRAFQAAQDEAVRAWLARRTGFK